MVPCSLHIGLDSLNASLPICPSSSPAGWESVKASIMGHGEPVKINVEERESKREKISGVSRDAGASRRMRAGKPPIHCGPATLVAHLPLAHGSCSCSIKSTPGWLLFARVPAPPLPFLLGDAGRGPLGQRQPHIMRGVEAAMCLAGRMTKGCRPLCGLCRSELLSSRAYLSRPFS